jgi:hypothetical protein
MQCHRILRAIREGSRNTFTVGKRASSGVTRDVGGAGKPVPSADAWHWRAVRGAKETPGNWPGLARRDQAGSPPSHTWRGPCLIQRGTGDSTKTETPARTRIPVATAICRTPRRIIRRRRRTPQCDLPAGRASGGGTPPDDFSAAAFRLRCSLAGSAACAVAPNLGTLISRWPRAVSSRPRPRGWLGPFLSCWSRRRCGGPARCLGRTWPRRLVPGSRRRRPDPLTAAAEPASQIRRITDWLRMPHYRLSG